MVHTSGLAIASLVLGCIGILVPLLAPVALVLGVVSLVKISSSRGAVGGQGLAIGGIATGGFGCLLIPILVAVAFPTFVRYVNKSKSAEARLNLARAERGANAYFQEHGAYPEGDTGWVPTEPCPERKCQPDPKLWGASPWSDLAFEVSSPHYYQYRYVSTGSAFTLEARADLDQDGTFGEYRVSAGETIEHATPGVF